MNPTASTSPIQALCGVVMQTAGLLHAAGKFQRRKRPSLTGSRVYMALPPEDVAGDQIDLSLVRRCQRGDLEAYGELISKYQEAIGGLLFRFSRETGNLEDMVQETFVRAWRGLEGWSPRRPFVHWLRRIAIRVGLEFYRKHQRSPFARIVETDRDPSGNLLDLVIVEAENTAAEDHSGEEVHRILAHLPPEERTLLTLLYLEQMPLSEVAAHCGWSVANTKIKAFRARRKLRSILTRHGYTP